MLHPLLAAALLAFSTTPERKPSVALLPFSAKNVLPSDAELISDGIVNALQADGAVRVVERSQIDRILQEQSFQNSGACDQSECAVEIGRLLSIDRIIVGSLGMLGTSHILNVRMVNVETGEIESQYTRQISGGVEEYGPLFPEIARSLALPIGTTRGEAPKPSRPTSDRHTNGTILSVFGGKFFLDQEVQMDSEINDFHGIAECRATLDFGIPFLDQAYWGLGVSVFRYTQRRYDDYTSWRTQSADETKTEDAYGAHLELRKYFTLGGPLSLWALIGGEGTTRDGFLNGGVGACLHLNRYLSITAGAIGRTQPFPGLYGLTGVTGGAGLEYRFGGR